MRQDIFVTNHNDFHHSDCYDGVEYEFPPKERVAISPEAATHMFGFNLPDKSDVLTRLGWAWNYDPGSKKFVETPEGVKKLAKFVFTKAVMVEAPIDAPDPEPVGLAPGAPLLEPAAAVAKPEGAMAAFARKAKDALPFLQSSAPLV